MNTRTLVLSAFLFQPFLHATEPPIEDLLRQGLFEEEANRDFDKAEERYRAVVAANDKQRALAATATYRLGEIARKKNNKEAAAQAFRAVVERFPEQEDLVRLSRENLATLGMGIPQLAEGGDTGASSVPAPPVDPQDQEIANLKQTARTSPDLLDGANSDGWRPMHTAARNGWVKVISFLLDNKADPNSRTSKEQLTPLQIASIYGHLAAVSRLLEAKAGLNATFYIFSVAPDLLPARERSTEKASGDWTALDLAILYDRREIARTLIKEGANLTRSGPNLQAITGQCTSLMLAIGLGRDELAMDLIAAGAPVNGSEDTLFSPLFVALKLNRKMVEPLLKAGAKPDSGDRTNGTTPLQLAVGFDNKQAITALIAAGADVKIADKEGQTALHLAPNAEAVDTLVAKGADPNAKDKEGNTPLDMVAISRGLPGSQEAFLALLKHVAKPEDSAVLLWKASEVMLPLVRDRVVYPQLYREDSILVSISGEQYRKPLAAIAETRPAVGSPPPGIADILWLFYQNMRYSSNLDRIRIVRRDAGGAFHERLAISPKNQTAEFPPLEWGDIVEITASNRGPADGFAIVDFIRSLPPRTVNLRLNGMTFPRSLEDPRQFWLGSTSAFFNRLPKDTTQPNQPGLPQQPRPRTVVPPAAPVPPAPSVLGTGIRKLELIPKFADTSRVTVTRKGVAEPLVVDLKDGDAQPFSLVEGDLIDLTLDPEFQGQMEKEGLVFFLTSDLAVGGLDPAKGLAGLLTSAQQASGEWLDFDWTDLRIARGGSSDRIERRDLKAWTDSLPDDPSGASQWNWEEIWKANQLQAGDWVVIPRLKTDPNESPGQRFQSTRDKLQTIATRSRVPSSRTRVVPPPTPAKRGSE